MKLVINIDKKHFYIILATVLLVSGFVLVKAYGTNNPAVFGHTMNETLGLDIDGDGIVDDCEIHTSAGDVSVSDWVDFVKGGYLCSYMTTTDPEGICDFHI
ncbi:MAG: hypothetical protein ABIJ20_03090 [Nanoarchaeota archaeon]|nr:hypothetical protein [Nanoarchaeota archaeon]MBU1444716.1 hypothetical protein [Nanoarchaeota archaeon]MBU2420568.1 hypothetical protein [Nanoarchaeota archaeon]MBU2475791.1 hypothetical protein [Nanoarchaeota archaeon]